MSICRGRNFLGIRDLQIVLGYVEPSRSKGEKCLVRVYVSTQHLRLFQEVKLPPKIPSWLDQLTSHIPNHDEESTTRLPFTSFDPLSAL